MKIYHLNCGSVREIEATYAGPSVKHAVNHCLLIDTESAGLVLIETGLGLADIANPAENLGGAWVERTQPTLDPEETAYRQILRLGYQPADVKHILLTHLDVDHCGGLPDFPAAKVHILAAELTAALSEAPSFRYRPAHWQHQPDWQSYPAEADGQWFGFDAIQPKGLPEEFQLIPLGGHTAGHTGVAVKDDDGHWLLHCGDAYYYHRELQTPVERHPLLDQVQTGAEVQRELRLGTQARLRELVREHGAEVTLFSAHDPWEFAELSTPIDQE